ncbi:MAG TPA: hypothetical protein VLD16_13825 [Gaiellaceae bacterium]|nr:hypothetical protein [Gaiellaceae bacterium]
MTKIAAIVAGVLLMAGVALAGTAVSLGASGAPTIGSRLPIAAATTTARHDTHGRAVDRREHVRREDRRMRAADDRGHHRRGHDHGGHHGHGGHGADD